MLGAEVIKMIYNKLAPRYGTQLDMFNHPPFRMILAAFLKDAMSFKNLAKTLDRFDAYPSPDRLARLHLSVISEKLSLCSAPETTARHLSFFLSKLLTWGYLPEHYSHYSFDELRGLFLKEIIPKKSVVDFILLYAFNFPLCAVDSGVQRLLARIDPDSGWDKLTHEALSQAVAEGTDGDIQSLKELSMLLLRVSAEHCAPEHPACRTCPLVDICTGAGEF